MSRPRDADAERAILDATLALVGECGFGRLSVEAVAARAGVGKATIYRRWASREELVMAAAASVAGTVEPHDTGTLRGDLVAGFTHMAAHVGEKLRRRLVPALMAEAHHNPALRPLVNAFADARRQHTGDAFDRAAARGEVPPDLDVELVIDLLVGPIIYRLLVFGETTSPARVEAIVDHVLAGMGHH